MPTGGGFEYISGPADADFLALEDIVYGFTRRLHDDDDDDSDEDDDDFDSEDGGNNNTNPWILRRCRPNSSLKCPVCKADHMHKAPSNDLVPEENRYSHDARVVYASFGCPICLEDPAGPPMVVLPCGHGVCQKDFRLLGGKTADAQADEQVRRAANEETQQHRETIRRNNNNNNNQQNNHHRPRPHPIPPFLRGAAGRVDDMDQLTMAMMHAFASSLNEAMEQTTTSGTAGNNNNNGRGNNNNNNSEDDDEESESTDSEMPELIRPPVLSFSESSDDDDNNNNSNDFFRNDNARTTTTTRRGRRNNPPDDIYGRLIPPPPTTTTTTNPYHLNPYSRDTTAARRSFPSSSSSNNNPGGAAFTLNAGLYPSLSVFGYGSSSFGGGRGGPAIVRGSNRVNNRGRHPPPFRTSTASYERRYHEEDDEDEDDDSSDGDYDYDYDSDDDDDNDDSEYHDPEEVIYRLSEYHPGNAVLSDPPTHRGFPKLGQWLLVPEMADGNTLNLIYYCEYSEENNLFVAKQFPRGSKMIPNSKHGVYVYTPPIRRLNNNNNNNNNGRSRGRQWPRINDLWDVYYVKNSKPDYSNDRNRRRGGGRRQESAQVLSTTVSDPVFRYNIPRGAQLVADGKGGIWALCLTASLPECLTSQIVVEGSREEDSATLQAQQPTNDNNNNEGNSSSNNSSSSSSRNRRQRGVSQRTPRECRLVHYTRQERDGVIVGGVFQSTCKLFMDRSGGVILLQPNNSTQRCSSSSSSFSSLWHISNQRTNPQQTLLYGGLPSDIKVVGDSTGSSVFLLSSGGRLQSILTRVMIEHSNNNPASAPPDDEDDDTPVVRSTTCFSYDLDFSVDDIQDIADVAEGNTNEVFLHARMPNPSLPHPSQQFRWRLCRVTPRSEAAGERNANIIDLDVDCPRTCRIVSDRESGVWVWKKPSYHISPGDRCFVHVHASNNEEELEEWISPCVFPPRTHLASLI